LTKTKVYIMDASKVRSFTDQITRQILDNELPRGSSNSYEIWNHLECKVSMGEVTQDLVAFAHVILHDMISTGGDSYSCLVYRDWIFTLQLHTLKAWKVLV